MILGILTILISIFACLQLATEYILTAVIYYIFVVILILFLIGAGAFWVNVSPSYPSFVNGSFERAYSDFNEYQMHLHQSWSVLQTELQCCGLNGMSDFENIHVDVPNECCRNKNASLCSPEDMILEGCIVSFLFRVYCDRIVISVVALLAGCLMLLMLVGSIFICFDEDDEVNCDIPYCIEDEDGGQYYEQVINVEGSPTAAPGMQHPKQSPFPGRDLT